MINSIDSSVTLNEVLDRREARVKQQQALLKRYACPLVSFTVNMPGPVKMNETSLAVMSAGLEALKTACVFAGWTIVNSLEINENTGPEAIISVDLQSAMLLKERMMSIETDHPLGRLMDLDVIDTDGRIVSIRGTKQPRRKCFLCEEDAVICARSKKHDIDSLVQKIKELTYDYACGN